MSVEFSEDPITTKKRLNLNDRRAIAEWLLKESKNGKLKHGSVKEASRVGRKRIQVDINQFKEIPLCRRTNIRSLSFAINMAKSTNVSLFGALLFFMDMNLIKMKQDVMARKEKRLREMNKRVDEETLTIVVAYSQESIMSQQNIMREILSWLPVKSLLRFKCVSKSWRNNVDMKAPHTLKKRFGSRFRDTLSFVHGAFHWIPCCFGVASFNISNEVCTEIPLSEQMYSYLSLSTTENNHVSVLDGMLCFSSACKVGGEETFMLWAMKDYGVKESWTQIFKINISHIRFVKPIYRFADGDVLFHCRDYMHDLLSTSKGRFSHPLIQHQDMVEVITFNESLISPKLLI
uniref:F-box family protein n=1 Tax=Solanum tuberosum TaxID=4113 RepID=M1C5F6_SOLTU